MKEVIIIFAFLLALATSIKLVPIVGNQNRLSLLTVKVKPLAEPEPDLKVLSKHNLNRGQLKKMHWLRYADKV